MVFSLVDVKSLDSIRALMKKFLDTCPTMLYALIATHKDMESISQTVVSNEVIGQVVSQFKNHLIGYYSVSSKTCEGVHEMWQHIVNTCFEAYHDEV